MFVLRSYEPDSDSLLQPGCGQVDAAAETCPAIRDEQLDYRTEWQRRSWTARSTAQLASEDACQTQGQIPGKAGSRRDSIMSMPLFAAAFAVRFGGSMAVLECQKHCDDAQALIDRVAASVERARNHVPDELAGLVDGLLEDARMMLATARRNHERPRGAFDHARAFAKADVALGHARAAQIVLSRTTPK